MMGTQFRSAMAAKTITGRLGSAAPDELDELRGSAIDRGDSGLDRGERPALARPAPPPVTGRGCRESGSKSVALSYNIGLRDFRARCDKLLNATRAAGGSQGTAWGD